MFSAENTVAPHLYLLQSQRSDWILHLFGIFSKGETKLLKVDQNKCSIRPSPNGLKHLNVLTILANERQKVEFSNGTEDIHASKAHEEKKEK